LGPATAAESHGTVSATCLLPDPRLAGLGSRALAGLARLCSPARFTVHGSASSPARGRLRGRRASQTRRQPSLRPRDPTVCRRLCERAARVSACRVSTRSELCDLLPLLRPPTPALALAQASRRRVLGKQTARTCEPTAVARPCKAGHVATLLRGRSHSRAVAAQRASPNRCAPAQLHTICGSLRAGFLPCVLAPACDGGGNSGGSRERVRRQGARTLNTKRVQGQPVLCAIWR
jgi:hypothetical protein